MKARIEEGDTVLRPIRSVRLVRLLWIGHCDRMTSTQSNLCGYWDEIESTPHVNRVQNIKAE